MPVKTLAKALREAGLEQRDKQLIIDNPEFAKLAVGIISLLRTTFTGRTAPYHGKADLSRLPEVMKMVRRRDGQIRDYAVAEELGLKPKTFSRLLNSHPEIRLQYDNLRSTIVSHHG